MQPTIEILDRIRKNSRDNKEEIFTRLYRYLLRPDLYYLAYKNLYANKGAGTKGVNDDTAEDRARSIIDKALKTAETKKREALLEVKEESSGLVHRQSSVP